MPFCDTFHVLFRMSLSLLVNLLVFTLLARSALLPHHSHHVWHRFTG